MKDEDAHPVTLKRYLRGYKKEEIAEMLKRSRKQRLHISFGDKIKDIEDPVVGIDLGTTEIRVGLLIPETGEVEIVKNKLD